VLSGMDKQPLRKTKDIIKINNIEMVVIFKRMLYHQ
jgi:hypothetical protein